MRIAAPLLLFLMASFGIGVLAAYTCPAADVAVSPYGADPCLRGGQSHAEALEGRTLDGANGHRSS